MDKAIDVRTHARNVRSLASLESQLRSPLTGVGEEKKRGRVGVPKWSRHASRGTFSEMCRRQKIRRRAERPCGWDDLGVVVLGGVEGGAWTGCSSTTSLSRISGPSGG